MPGIEIGEYVRTNDGKFGLFNRYSSRKEDSIFKSPFNCFIKMQKRKTDLQCCREYIKSHSKNIIDLIEVGDYVNGEKVYKITEALIYLRGKAPCHKSISDIKSIVTKEQFKQVQYEVRD